MMGKLLLRGLLAGLVAGLLGFLAATVLGEPHVERAVAFERFAQDSHDHTDGEAGQDSELVSRPLQRTAGLSTGALIYGVALGGIVALVFAGLYGRGTRTNARSLAALIGLVGFVGVYLVPILKYPASPPGIGLSESVERRTTLFLVMILCSLAALALAGVARLRLLARTTRWNATVSASLIYVIAVAVAYVALPGVNEVPQVAVPGVTDAVADASVTFPPVLLWNFRLASLFVQLVLWTVVALGFGWLAERLLEARSEPLGTGVGPAQLAASR